MGIRNAALYALSRGIETGQRHTIFLALRGIDPLLRHLAQSRLLRALRFAELNTAIADPAHQFRVAGLKLCGVIPEDGYESQAVVREHFEQLTLNLPRPRRGPRWVGALLGVPLLCGLGIWIASQWLAPFDPRNQLGGQLLGEELTEYLVAHGAEDPEAWPKLRARLTGGARSAFGDQAAEALDRALAGTSLMFAATADDPDRMDGVINAITDFDTYLARARQPYFLDVDALRARRSLPLLLSFYIERDRTVHAAGQDIRVVHLWRLDDLALRQGYLGYTRPHTPAALVLLDQVESDLLGDVLPALPEDESMEFVDFRTRHLGKSWVAQIESAAASAVRRHFAAMPQTEQERFLRVARLLSARRQLVYNWQVTLQALGARLRVPRRLIPEADYLGELELKVPRAQLREWDHIHDELLEDEPLRAFHELRDNYVRAVERHEVQHRIDYAENLFEVPEVLAERLNVENRLAAEPGTLAGRARDELSAFLATIATAEPTPLLELALLARHLFHEQGLGGPYSYAALGAFESIARELALESVALERRVVQRTHLADLVTKVLAVEPAQLRTAAARAYQHQYGRPLHTPQLIAETRHERWRH